ncbi:MAG: hypothetical protein IPF87_11885 [Gemmatimonadetes bacterium]|jgi:hypothetical protein|nr:hypothetical protein [Gemmatimonadota bacterium]MBK6842279.1 hypothetical protein [Gemmatimonadota bacterium]MBK7835983.1 hypothetical protein [Gemmatimonadota bacterium]MBK8062377.1 hypothetical protein [Gemmatimonadota bacterium]MBK8646027.1 hypothetical protein [Gemmatimonadota bacterium]
MSVFVSMGAVAVLFIIFGLFVAKRECDHGGGCAGCGAACHRRPASREEIV